MLEFDPVKVRRNVEEAKTDDLLDRVTAFREGMEPAAVRIIEEELFRRGVGPAEIDQYRQDQAGRLVMRPEGFAYRCSFCQRPATVRRVGWHRLWGLIPILPRVLNYCPNHAPEEVDAPKTEPPAADDD